MNNNIELFSDGGSRGNPGPAASAFVAEKNGKIIYCESKYLKIQTNNVAEYSAVELALSWLNKYSKKNKIDSVIFHLDSLLIVNQLSGVFKIKSESLKKYFLNVKGLENNINCKIKYVHVYREKNKMADLLVNKCLDQNFTLTKTVDGKLPLEK